MYCRLKKIKKLVKFAQFAAIIFLVGAKFAFMLLVLGKLMQFKLLILVAINTLINLLHLWLGWKKHDHHHETPIVHFEEAHHEHLHDDHHFKEAKDDKGWLGGLWSRNSLQDTISTNLTRERGHKKKKKGKLKALIHLIKIAIVVVIIKLKIAYDLWVLGKLLEIKSVFFVAINTIINKIYLWWEWKRKKEEKQKEEEDHKIVHIEESHHDHVHEPSLLDSLDFLHKESPAGYGGYGHYGHSSNSGHGHGWYEKVGGTGGVGTLGSSHDLVYSAQKPWYYK
ncbi:hypothetical protein C0J52_11185 [Blattella germanica]|nr:hypothetical protein C0J52_11185 [Blattella germanica]